MRLLYFCTVNKTQPLEAGVYKKIIAQCKVLANAGHSVMLVCREGASDLVLVDEKKNVIRRIDLSLSSKLRRNHFITNFVYGVVKDMQIDCVYSRYGTFSFNSYRLYSKLRASHVYVLLEIPSYPLKQRWNGVRQSIRNHQYVLALKDIYANTVGSLGIPFFKKCIDRIVNNNGFDVIWNIPVLKITNGIDVSIIPDKPRVYHKDTKVIRIMSVANVANWHGFDRLIYGLSGYYKTQRNIIVKIEIAGPGQEVELLKNLAKKLKVDKYISFLGPVVGEELDELFDRSDIGISVLGVHRVNMRECDSLKAREFCARRLPFLTEEAESQYVGKPFVRIVPSDESPINILEILSFYNSIVEHPDYLDIMREFAETECDWKNAFKNVVDYINKK